MRYDMWWLPTMAALVQTLNGQRQLISPDWSGSAQMRSLSGQDHLSSPRTQSLFRRICVGWTGPHALGDDFPVQIKPEYAVGRFFALPLELNLLFAQLRHLLGGGNELIMDVLRCNGQSRYHLERRDAGCVLVEHVNSSGAYV
jgi:hypothetical protein